MNTGETPAQTPSDAQSHVAHPAPVEHVGLGGFYESVATVAAPETFAAPAASAAFLEHDASAATHVHAGDAASDAFAAFRGRVADVEFLAQHAEHLMRSVAEPPVHAEYGALLDADVAVDASPPATPLGAADRALPTTCGLASALEYVVADEPSPPVVLHPGHNVIAADVNLMRRRTMCSRNRS